jgi:AraC-like DNA-binding protein
MVGASLGPVRRGGATGNPIGSIALDLGFYDQSAFNKLFRKHLGMSPRAYRRLRAR